MMNEQRQQIVVVASNHEDENNSDDESNLFYINKNGFPIDDKTWNRMWRYASKIYPDAKKDMDQIKKSESLMEVPISPIPVFCPQMSVIHCLKLVQDYISSLSYNHTGTQMFEIKKSRPLAGLMDKAKEMIREALPIKCLEAVILALYLTNCLPNVERFPIGFKSVFKGSRFYHVVLGVYHNGHYGALGLSRRHDLMDKPLCYKTLGDLIESYDTAYSKYTHELRKVRVGGIVSHSSCSQEKILWDIFAINYSRTDPEERRRKLDLYSRNIKSHYPYVVPLIVQRKENYRMPIQFRREHTVHVSKDKRESNDLKRETKSANNIRDFKNNSKPAKYHLKV